MTDADFIHHLVTERIKLREMIRSIDADLSNAARDWGYAQGYLVKLTPEQVLRELEKRNV